MTLRQPAAHHWQPAGGAGSTKDVLLTTKDPLNHARSVRDEFREQGLRHSLGAAMFPLHLAGVVILGVGALT